MIIYSMADSSSSRFKVQLSDLQLTKEDGMIYRFGDCAFDTAQEILLRADEVISMEPQALKVLHYLLQHRDRIVSRDELLEACWPDSYVSDAALTTCLRRVRQAMGQQRQGPVFIETLHRRGYRFVAKVSEIIDPEAPAPAATASHEPPALIPEPPEIGGPVILVVDDEPNNRELLEQHLQGRGYATCSASDGQAALDQVAAEAPDLILLDIRLPVMDGYTVCRQLKSQDDTRGIPIILLTALDSAQDRIRGLEAGADAFLTKPVRSQALMAQIEIALRNKQEAPAPPENPVAPAPASPALTPEPVARPAPAVERRHLSVLSCTLCHADTPSWHLDPEDLYDLLQAFRSTCIDVVAPYDGYVAHQFDDGVVIYFGYPQAHEDDAQRAVRSGLALVGAMQGGAMAAFAPPGMTVQVGIATGIMVISSGRMPAASPPLGVGSASTVAVRIGALARPGTVVISEDTAQLVSGYFECKALEAPASLEAPEAQLVYEVQGESALQTRLEVELAQGLTPFVGREAEITLLAERWTYVQESLGQVVWVQGEAGIGKSRLVQVLKERVTGPLTMVWECRCTPHHQNTALYPLVDLTQRVLQDQSTASPEERLERLEAWLAPYGHAPDDTVSLLADLLSLRLPAGRYAPLDLTPQRRRERTLETLLSLLLAQAGAAPLLLIMEDAHWADPSTLDFLQLLTDQVTTAPILLVVTCRPEFQRPWDQRIEMTQVMLSRLTRAQTEQMITGVAAGKNMPATVLHQLVEKTDGVPLFVEELTRMVLESGQLVEQDSHYELRGELWQLTIPVTLHDSLMARLDRLDRGRAIAQWGAALGREFSYEVLEAVTPYGEAELQAGLEQLVESGLVFQRGLLPQVHYRFKHALVQEAAYQSLHRRTRQAYHQQIAEGVAAQFPETTETEPELLAYHYTEAGAVEAAVTYWQRAGQRALERSATPEARAHLRQGLALLRTGPDTLTRQQQEFALQVALGDAFLASQENTAVDLSQAEACLQHALGLARQQGALSWELRAATRLARLWLQQGKVSEARDLLAPMYEQVTEGVDAADWQAAKTLLDALSP